MRSNQFMELPLRGVVGCRLPVAEATDNRQPTTDNERSASPLFLDGHPHLEKIDRRAHVMNAYDRRACALSGGDGGQRSEGPVGSGGASGQVADERFARCADDQWSEGGQFARARQQLQVLI